MQQITWVVVTDSSQAKIFRATKFPKIEMVEVLTHPESRFRDQDLVSSKPGRNFQRGGIARHAYQSVSDPKVVEVEKFATYLNEYLIAAHNQGAFNRLYILANPSFLGHLRSHVDPQIQKLVVHESAKDITAFTTDSIEKHIAAL